MESKAGKLILAFVLLKLMKKMLTENLVILNSQAEVKNSKYKTRSPNLIYLSLCNFNVWFNKRKRYYNRCKNTGHECVIGWKNDRSNSWQNLIYLIKFIALTLNSNGKITGISQLTDTFDFWWCCNRNHQTRSYLCD